MITLREREFRVEMWFSLDLNTKPLCFTVRRSPIEDLTSCVCSSGFQLLSSGNPRQRNLFQPWTNTSDSTIISLRWINWIKCISLTSYGGNNPSWIWNWNGLFMRALMTLIHDGFNIHSVCSRLTEETALWIELAFQQVELWPLTPADLSALEETGNYRRDLSSHTSFSIAHKRGLYSSAMGRLNTKPAESQLTKTIH